jgi:hypothetical protein
LGHATLLLDRNAWRARIVIDDSRACLTNDAAERASRVLCHRTRVMAIRLPVGGADRAAVTATPIMTAKLNWSTDARSIASPKAA